MVSFQLRRWNVEVIAGRVPGGVTVGFAIADEESQELGWFYLQDAFCANLPTLSLT